MPSPRPARRAALAVTATVALTGSALAALPAAASTVSTATVATQSATQVTAFLTAPDLAALQRLAEAKGLTHAQRVARLRTLVPSSTELGKVAAGLRAEGLTVDHETAWSVTASGTSTAVASSFGSRPKLAAHPSVANRAAATGSLPLLPASLSGLVSAVYPTSGGPAAYHDSATGTLSGTDFRNAYTAAGTTPTTGENDSAATIATIQLATFNSSDLSTYARNNSLPDPVADGQYTAVTVDGGPTAARNSSDVEVDLDQEALLSTAPSAHQQAYFAPNTSAGFTDVFASVYDNAVDNSHATAPNSHIVALSTSWGSCETLTRASGVKALQPILTSLVAAGVTVFAAAGDDGIYDCGSANGTGTDNTQADVDYPGSSPDVVSVGGSSLSASTSAANTGSNWRESAWSCSGSVSCASTSGTGGSGGGESGSAYNTETSHTVDNFKGFAAPEYQSETIKDSPFAGATNRLVPDIASDADPASGFAVYTSDPSVVASCGSTCVYGGTSLAAPTAAAELTNLLADHGITTGIGDIHAALYSAYTRTASLPSSSSSKVFRDITSGSNGASSNRSSDPSVHAQTGYDTVSGLGGVLWNALLPYLTNTARPSASASASVLGHPSSSTGRLKIAWTSRQGSDSNVLGPATVSLVRAGSHRSVYRTSTAATSGNKHLTVSAGTYVLAVTATDIGGRTSSVARYRIHVSH